MNGTALIVSAAIVLALLGVVMTVVVVIEVLGTSWARRRARRAATDIEL